MIDLLSAGRVHIGAPDGVHHGIIPGGDQGLMKLSNPVRRRLFAGTTREGIARNQVDPARPASQQTDQFAALPQVVVNRIDQGAGKGNLALVAKNSLIDSAGLQQFPQRVTVIQGNQLTAQLIFRSVQEHHQRDIGRLGSW